MIGFPDTMEAIQRQVETKDSLSLIGREAERLSGGPVKVRIERQSTPPVTAAAAPLPDAKSSSDGDVDGLLEVARQEPGVQKLMDAFGAHVVGIQRQDAPDTKKTRIGRRARPPEDSP